MLYFKLSMLNPVFSVNNQLPKDRSRSNNQLAKDRSSSNNELGKDRSSSNNQLAKDRSGSNPIFIQFTLGSAEWSHILMIYYCYKH
jgi:hypothetical protein